MILLLFYSDFWRIFAADLYQNIFCNETVLKITSENYERNLMCFNLIFVWQE